MGLVDAPTARRGLEGERGGALDREPHQPGRVRLPLVERQQHQTWRQALGRSEVQCVKGPNPVLAADPGRSIENGWVDGNDEEALPVFVKPAKGVGQHVLSVLEPAERDPGLRAGECRGNPPVVVAHPLHDQRGARFLDVPLDQRGCVEEQHQRSRRSRSTSALTRPDPAGHGIAGGAGVASTGAATRPSAISSSRVVAFAGSRTGPISAAAMPSTVMTSRSPARA